jgi:hypothetical protein
MSKRETFLLRVDPQILEQLKRWSEDELRSTNAQIEYLLRQALHNAGRLSPLKGELIRANNATDEGDKPAP